MFDLKFSFVGLPAWTDVENTHVRVKFENGIIFLKPVRTADLKRGRPNDVFEIVSRSKYKVECILPADYVLWDRVASYLQGRGWQQQQAYFPLHMAARGWFSLTLGASNGVPTEQPYVSIEPVSAMVREVSFDYVREVMQNSLG